MESARKSGTCARHQRQLREAIKRARHLALLPHASEHRRVTGPVAPPRTEERVEARPDPSAAQVDVAGQLEPEAAAAEEKAAETKAEAVPEPEATEEETGQPEPEAAAAEEEAAETKAEADPAPEAEVDGEEAEEERPET